MNRQVNHNNIFESYIAQDVFVLDILDKIASDMKQTERRAFTQENFEDFVSDEFMQWIELGLQTYVEEEWGENE